MSGETIPAPQSAAEVTALASTQTAHLKEQQQGILGKMADLFGGLGDDGQPRNKTIKPEDRDKYNQYVQELVDVNAQIEEAHNALSAIEQAERIGAHANAIVMPNEIRIRADQNGISIDEATYLTGRDREAWGTYLKEGEKGVAKAGLIDVYEALPRNTVTTGESSSPYGGYAVPTLVAARLTEIMKTYSAMLQEGTVESVPSGADEWEPTVNDTDNEGDWPAEDGNAGDQDAQLGRVKFTRDRVTSKIIAVSRKWLLSTTIPQAENRLYGLLAQRIARAKNKKFSADTTVGINNRATVQTRVGSSATTIPVGSINGMFYGLDEAYRDGAIWMMADTSLVILANMTVGSADSRPLIMVSYAEGFGMVPTLHGKRIRANNHLPAMADGAKSVIFGDIRQYVSQTVQGSEMIHRFAAEEKYAKRGNVGFLMEEHCGGNLLVPEAVRVFHNKK